MSDKDARRWDGVVEGFDDDDKAEAVDAIRDAIVQFEEIAQDLDDAGESAEAQNVRSYMNALYGIFPWG